MKTRTRVLITEKKFGMVKALLDSNSFSVDQIAGMSEISSASVYHIKNASDFEDYKVQTIARSNLHKARVEERKKKQAQIEKAFAEAVDEVKSEQNEQGEQSEQSEQNEQEKKVIVNDNPFSEAQLDVLIETAKSIDQKLSQIVALLGVPKTKQQEIEEEQAEEKRRGFFSFKPF